MEVHQGYFERAEGGTLFLDEVDSLSPGAQTRLLRVIQEGELERVGAKHAKAADVRIISATNKALEQLVETGNFRHDLYYRLNVIRFNVPPLAERQEDMPYLVNAILQRLNQKHKKSVESVSRTVMQKIRAYHWPGNVRELENVLERSLLFASGSQLTELDLDIKAQPHNTQDWKAIKENALACAEKVFLEAALKQCQGDIKQVAAHMGMTTRAIYLKLNKHHINKADFVESNV